MDTYDIIKYILDNYSEYIDTLDVYSKLARKLK